jgi:hypothetical protein
MGDVLFSFDVDAKPETIRQALTTAEGIAGFWTDEASVPAEIGKTLTLGFPEAPAPFDLVLTESEHDVISWRTQSFPPQWSELKFNGRYQPAIRLQQSRSGMAPSPTKQSKGRWRTCGVRSWFSSSGTPRLESPHRSLSTHETGRRYDGHRDCPTAGCGRRVCGRS